MANKEKIDYLLLDIRELERLVAGMRNAEVYPVSFFGQTFDLTHKILKDLHTLETVQIETLRKQMEEHQALIQSIPPSVAVPEQTVQESPIMVPVPIPPPTKPTVQEPEVKQTETVEIVTEVPQKEMPAKEPLITKTTPVMSLAVETKQEIPAEKKFTGKPESSPVEKPESRVEVPVKGISTERSGLFLNDLLEKKNLSDFRKAFSLNDRFRFRRELFGGDEARMNKTINDLNALHSYEDSVAYLNNELKWNIEDEAVADFIKLLEKRFL